MKIKVFLSVILIFEFFTGCLFFKKNHKDEEPKVKKIICQNKAISLDLLDVKKLDTLYYEEGSVYHILTDDECSIVILCGGNASFFNGDDYKTLTSSTKKNGSISLKGVNTSSGLYWRKDGNIGFENVREKDTIKYNRIFDNKKFITRPSSPRYRQLVAGGLG